MVKAHRTSSRNPKSSSDKPRPSGSKANAAGYAKRHSKKAAFGLSTDVYEYAPEASRRSKVTLDLDRDEAAEYGVGVDGDNDEAQDELMARLIGENGEDEMIDSGDDEEVDSDAAFEESDEDRFAGFFSAKGKKKVMTKKKPIVRFAEINLNEDEEMAGENSDREEEEEEEEEGDDDEFVDVLDVLDGRGEVDTGSDAEDRQKVKRTGEHEEAEAEAGDEEDEDEDDSEEEEKRAFSPSDSEDVAPEALDELENFISTLDPTAQKRKAPDNESSGNGADRSRKQRRLTLKEHTEAGVENEFRAQTSGTKLNLDDLLAPLASHSSTLQSLKQSTKILGSSSSKAKALAAPLPQRAQERLDREAAYEQTKEEVDKWSGTMKRIREAEHLSFPLQAKPAGRVSNLELAAKFKPTTALESSVDMLLKSAKLREEDIQHTEETMLKMNKLTVEEVEQRRAELRKMRELMFRAEIKARRVGKIKSKTYRKIKRKERERLGEKLAEDREDSEGEEGQLKREVERARERATLRHKHTGKWAKQMRGREGMGEEGRREIEEMLARGERLRRRIKGVGSDEDSEEESEDDELDGDEEGGIERIKQSAFDELKRVEMEDGRIRIEASGSKSKSVFEMKFMKDAMARQQQAADRMLDDFVNEMGAAPQGDADDSDVGENMAQEMDLSSGVVAERVGGRLVYRPGATTNRPSATRPVSSLASDTSSVTLKSLDLISPPQSPVELQRPIVPLPKANESNPWLLPRDPGSTSSKAPKKKNEVVVGKDTSVMSKSKNKLKKEARKRDEERTKAKDDAVVEISTEKVLSLSSAPLPAVSGSTSISVSLIRKETLSTSKPKSVKVEREVKVDYEDDEHDSEIEEQEKALGLKGKGKANGPRAFEQRDLVALAFAGDNVVHEFEEAKKREIAADAPRQVDTTIPGWGAWGGTGTRVAPPKTHRLKKVAGVDPTTRADYGKAHVIISEKRDKKAAKYLVKDLPYPYTSKAQFDRTMERPLGTEWNTRVAFQRGTLPRVVKKPGMIINALEKLT